MSRLLLAHKVFVASPADVQRERILAVNTIQQWNDEHSDASSAILRPILWERAAAPELGSRPQEIVNRRLVRDADVLVAIFWTQVGSSTGKAVSGTVEEIEEFCDAGKPALIYFSRRPVRLENMNTDQWARLRRVEEKYRSRGIVWSYRTISEFQHFLRRHLTDAITRLSDSSQVDVVSSRPPRGARSALSTRTRKA